MTPWDLIVWAFAGGVAVVIFSVGVAIATAMVSAARALTK